MRGLIAKTLREVRLTVLLFALSLGAVELTLAWILPIFTGEEYGQWLEMRFVQHMVTVMLGTEVGTSLDPRMITSIAWVHGIVLAITWAQAITLCTRVPAGEVDRGTIDVLLGLPVSRTKLYCCESLVWLIAGVVTVLTGLAGNLVGGQGAREDMKMTLRQMVIVVANLWSMYVAVGGMSWMVSSLSDRRGRAVCVALAIVLTSFFLNFVTQLWAPARSFAFLGVLDYYRPLTIMRTSAWPVGDMLVLLGAGCVSWLIGAIVFARRDIRTL